MATGRLFLAFAAAMLAAPLALLGQNPPMEELYQVADGRQSIQVWRNGSAYGGRVVSYLAAFVERDRTRKVSSEANLTEETARAVFLKLKELDGVPDMSRITEWEIGTDGITYSISHTSKGASVLRQYWTPSAQKDAVPHRKQIVAVLDFVYGDMQLRRYFDELLASQPEGKYTDGFKIWTISKEQTRKGAK